MLARQTLIGAVGAEISKLRRQAGAGECRGLGTGRERRGAQAFRRTGGKDQLRRTHPLFSGRRGRGYNFPWRGQQGNRRLCFKSDVDRVNGSPLEFFGGQL